MNNKSTPVVSIILYVIGLVFIAVSAFMLVLAINYTKTYIESYDATFADMWSNSLQYIITEFVPYLGLGIICLGMGYGIMEVRNLRNAKAEATAPQTVIVEKPVENREEGSHPDYIKAMEKLEAGIRYLENDIDTTREILSIKIEEKEKRDAYRLRGLGKDVIAFLGEAEDHEPSNITIPDFAELLKEVKSVPLFRVAQTMATPDIPYTVETAEAKAKPVPLFRVAQTMAMPDIDFV